MVSILRLRSMVTVMRDLSEIAGDKAGTEHLNAFKGFCQRFRVYAICSGSLRNRSAYISTPEPGADSPKVMQTNTGSAS